jgi:hypothetical protein
MYESLLTFVFLLKQADGNFILNNNVPYSKHILDALKFDYKQIRTS